MLNRRVFLLLAALPAACAPDIPPEQLAARRAETLLHRAGKPGATLLAPISGLDGEGQPGVCALIETPAGPVRVVVELATGAVRVGKPAAQGGGRLDLGEERWCSEAARKRWDQLRKVDPIGLVARIGG